VRTQVKEFDNQSSDAGSLTAAKAVVADESVIGVIGPVFSHEVDLIGERFAEAGLAFASPSATVPGLVGPNSGFFRGLPDERQLAESGANYLTARLGLTRICVVEPEFPETELAAKTVRELVGQQASPARSRSARVCAGTTGPRSTWSSRPRPRPFTSPVIRRRRRFRQGPAQGGTGCRVHGVGGRPRR
jgi:branched-chain amino acid transport system substrate-binding protein